MPDDFGYLNARLRIRRGQLLHEGFFQEALDLSYPEFLKALTESAYGAGLTGEGLEDVDRAVAEHLRRTIADLTRLASGRAREALRLLLSETDLTNLKAILRAREAGWSADDTMNHLLPGTLSTSLYRSMAEAPDAHALAQLLMLPRHPLAAAMRQAAAAGHDPLEREIVLDHAFYSNALLRSRDLDQPALAAFMRFRVDSLNLANAFKILTVGLEHDPGPLFLEGGSRVGLDLFQRVARGDTAALEVLGGTEMEPVAEARDLATLERGLHCLRLAKGRAGAIDVLGAGLAVDFIEHQQWEAGRIRLLARRAWFDLPREWAAKEIFCP